MSQKEFPNQDGEFYHPSAPSSLINQFMLPSRIPDKENKDDFTSKYT